MKSKKKIIIISAIASVVVVVAALVVLYFTTDIFKTPKQLFFKYMGRELKGETNINYNDMLEELKTSKEKSYTSNSNLKLEIDAEDDNEAYDIVNNLDLNLEQSVQPKENKSYNKVNLEYDEKELATIELVQNGDTYALKSDYIDEDKYIAIENNNLKDFLKKMGADEDIIEAIPDKITTLDLYELLYVSKEDQKTIMETYKKFIDENISDDNFKVNNKVDITINGENKKTTQYTLTLNEKEAVTIAINFMNTLKQDEVTLNLVIDKYNKYIENTVAGISMMSTKNALKNSSSLFDDEDITMTKEKLTKYIDEAIEELEDEKEDASEDSTMIISLYQAKGKVCRTELTVEDKKIITIDQYKSNDRNYIEIIVPTEKTLYTKRRRETIENKVIIDYTTKKQNEENNIEGNIKVIEDSEEQGNFKFNITEKGKIGKGVNETNIELSATVEENTVKVKLNNKTECKDDIEIIELSDNKDNVVTLNEMSKTEISELFEKITTNFQTKLYEKIQDIGLDNLESESSIKDNYDDEDLDWDIDTDDSEDEDDYELDY